MSITAERKAALIKEYAREANDTGSPEVQVAVLSEAHRQPHRAFQDPQEGQTTRAGACSSSSPSAAAFLTTWPGLKNRVTGSSSQSSAFAVRLCTLHAGRHQVTGVFLWAVMVMALSVRTREHVQYPQKRRSNGLDASSPLKTGRMCPPGRRGRPSSLTATRQCSRPGGGGGGGAVAMKNRSRKASISSPLTVNYTRKNTSQPGKSPVWFFKREGRPTEKRDADLAPDRPGRSARLFPKASRNDTQVMLTVLSHDMENDSRYRGHGRRVRGRLWSFPACPSLGPDRRCARGGGGAIQGRRLHHQPDRRGDGRLRA